MVSLPVGFVILLPAKSPGTAKSRLAALSTEERARLAGAFASDVVDACLATPGVAEVWVISDDADFAASLAARGAVACTDPGGGLNAALRHGAARARASRPGLRPVALCADLPALAAADLAAALDIAAGHDGASFVRDADGSGTSLYTAPHELFDPRFGPDSAHRHETAGARPVAGPLITLRRDVDDLEDLRTAMELGVGTATAHALVAVPLPR